MGTGRVCCTHVFCLIPSHKVVRVRFGHAPGFNALGYAGSKLRRLRSTQEPVFRALAAARAALPRSEMASRSFSATASRMWMISLLACGLSRSRRHAAFDLMRYHVM
jgi:hypothetical protein